MFMKIYLLGICFLLLNGCTQPKNIGWNYISCNESSNDIVQYSLEALERNYRCNKLKEVLK